MRFSEATAMATSIVCRPSVRERSVQLGIKARQFVFDGAQRLQHLAGQEELSPPLRLAYGQHAINPLLRPVLPQPCRPF
jgi:hypothetical protein